MVLSFILPAFVNYWWTWLCLMVGTMTLYTYFVPLLISTWLHAEQNLKTKYNADWAVVTGASSGIGRAIAEKLASQGINVVVVALEEPLLDEVMTALNDKFGPEGVQFRRVGANLGQAPEAYMPALTAATADILPKLIFNNAGFVVTGLFADSPLGRQMANYHCNATAPVVITHHFANRLLDAKVPGGICFTSSPAGFMPTPLTSTYASTKAFLTTFAASIAPELRPDGIDVLVVHPSPVDTAFYTGATHMAAMRMAQRASYAPTAIASSFFRSLGRVPVHDQGYMTPLMRILGKVIDATALSAIMSRFAGFSADYVRLKQARPLAAAPAPVAVAKKSEGPRAASVAASRSPSAPVVSQPSPARKRK